MQARWQQLAVATGASLAAVAVVTGVIALVQDYVPVLSLGVLYVFAVLPIAILWGLYGSPSRSPSRACSRSTGSSSRPSTRSRSRTARTGSHSRSTCARRSSSAISRPGRGAARRPRSSASASRRCWQELATDLLGGRALEDELDEIAQRAAGVLGVDRAEIELGAAHRPPAGQAPHPLEAAHRPVGAIYTPEGSEPNVAARARFLPALAALLAVAVAHDKLERDALEAETLRRSDLVKTALLRSVSHELRSPLTGIATAVGALRNRTLSLTETDRDDLLETIELESGRLNRLVADLLDLSRLEAGAAAPEREVWTLDDLVRQAVDSLGAGARVEVAGGESPLVDVDAAQIQRVLANLIENALKFSPPGAKVHVRITATRSEAIVRVVDQGPGLGADELERVFEAFHRGSGGAGGGAGLGLAIARGFAEANGGRVWAESRPGQGATFALALPRSSSPPSCRRERAAHPRRRRRAADPARAAHDAARRATRSRRPTPPRPRSPRRRPIRPRPSSSTWCCPTAAAPTSAASCAPGQTRR